MQKIFIYEIDKDDQLSNSSFYKEKELNALLQDGWTIQDWKVNTMFSGTIKEKIVTQLLLFKQTNQFRKLDESKTAAIQAADNLSNFQTIGSSCTENTLDGLVSFTKQ